MLQPTHVVENQPPPLEDYNVYLTDTVLQDAVSREGAEWAQADLAAFGAWAGSSEAIQLGFDANAHKPSLRTHDRRGHRMDEIDFHPSYHRMMQSSLDAGLHGSPWADPKPGAHVARAAAYYMQVGVEPGHLCPVTMTYAAVPALRATPSVADAWIPRVIANGYDARNVPDGEKATVTIGMAMTEKQGGSDVRTNTTRAQPQGDGTFELVGHKYFVSAPMCDAFLTLAHTDRGLTCFLVPRWRPDGTKNPLELQQLKNKMGNVSNASAETELRGALGWQVGDEGRGVATIIEMVAMTRFDVMLGSAGLMRQATVQAIHHTRHRRAFGATLIDQPLMGNVLLDLTIESEAALALTMRIARALDDSDDERERLLVRLGTAIGKYWISKRTPGHTYEAMECIGGMGAMEDLITARLYREAPINAIWEGSGNVQALDVLRAVHKEPKVLDVFLDEVRVAGGHRLLDERIGRIERTLTEPGSLEYRARMLTEDMALALTASLLLRSNSPIADAFIASRLEPTASGHLYGTVPVGFDVAGLIERSLAG